MTGGATLLEKIGDAHVVKRHEGERGLVVDRHVLQEATCAATFANLAREARRTAATLRDADAIASFAADRQRRPWLHRAFTEK